MEIYIYFSWIFAVFVLVLEVLRHGAAPKIDFLTFISTIYLVIFVISPTLVYATPPPSPWFDRFAWLKTLSPETPPYAAAAAAVFLSYLAVYVGYYFPILNVRSRFNAAGLGMTWAWLGVIFLTIGVISFFIFTEVVGGVVKTLVMANQLREGSPVDTPLASFAFVKRLTLFCLPASLFFLLALGDLVETRDRLIIMFLTAISILCSLVVLMLSGRLVLASYLLAFLMPKMTQSFRRSAYFVVGAVFFTIPIILFGKTLINRFTLAGHNTIDLSVDKVLHSILLEFSFPFTNIVMVVQRIPVEGSFRFFSDLVLAPLRWIPQRLFPFSLPERLIDTNTDLVMGNLTSGGIPVDIVSFGWYSAGALGVVIAGLLFGKLVRLLDDALPKGSYGAELFRATWILLAGFLIMYGYAEWLIVEQFHWLVALAVYLATCATIRRPYGGEERGRAGVVQLLANRMRGLPRQG